MMSMLRTSVLFAFCTLALILAPGLLMAQESKETVISACEYDYPPYCIVNPDNSVTGFSVELLRATLKTMGRDVSFRVGSWEQIKQDLADGRIQVLPLVGRTPEREAVFDFTFPYLTMHGTIVVREGTKDIQVPADLKGKSVAVLKGDNAEEYLVRSRLGARIIPLDSFDRALHELSQGTCDAVVIQKLVALQIIQKSGLTNLKTVGPPLEDFKQSFCFATRKGDRALLALLNEGLSVVFADGTFRELYATWFSGIESFGQAKSRIIVGGDSNYPPYEYLDKNGQPAGYNVDLTRAIARQLGLDIKIQLGTWEEIRKGLGTGAIDVVQGMFYSPERDRLFAFTPAHSIVNHVIAARKGMPLPDSIQGLAGKSVIVMAGDVMDDLATKMDLGTTLVRVASQEDALHLLAAGKYDYALVAQIPALYWTKQHGWHNLRFSPAPILAAEYCYALPNANGALGAQFSQGLTALQTTGEYRKIGKKWLVPYTGGVLPVVARYASIIIPSLFILLALMLLWSWSLKRRVTMKTRQLSVEVSVRMKAEEELKTLNRNLEHMVSERTVELEAANRELESFAYAVSHDLRSPLRSMEGFSSILADRYRQVLDEKGIDYLNRIRDASVRMGELIEALLGLSRVTRSALVRKEVDLSGLARDIIGEILESRKGRVPSVDIEPGMRAVADYALMRILLFNLLDNAVKYSSKSVSPRVEIGSMKMGEELIFFVKDNGAGFDMEYANKLFTPFQRLHSAKEFPGTGIGLVTVQRIVVRHGGRIWPDSVPGKGTTFRFTLG